MCPQSKLLYKFIILTLGLFLIMTMLAACGEEKENTSTPVPAFTATSTTTPTATTKATTTPASSGPVKIGAISSWSGPLALAGIIGNDVIALVEDQVKEMGGILGGRLVKVIIYDDAGQVSQALSGWSKLVLNERVSAVVYGGMTAATTSASADAAEKYKVPYFNMSPIPDDLSDLPYTIRCTYRATASVKKTIEFLLNELKPRTVAILCDDDQAIRERMANEIKNLEANGIKIVYEGYVPQGTIDFSSYLTRIRYADPEVLIASHAAQEYYIQICRQITELGGWGNIKLISPSPTSTNQSILKLPGAVGTYHWVLWLPGLNYPGAIKFEEDFVDKYGRAATSPHVFAYFPLWVAIKAIELAETDTDWDAIAKAARSGRLQWDSPAGTLVIGTDGEPNLEGFIAVIEEDGKLVPITDQQ